MTAQAVIHTPSGETAFQPVKDAQQARTLVQGAREGGLDLAKVPLRERRRLIAELQASVLTHREWLIERIVAETGKSRTDALVSEIMGVLDYLHWLHSRGWKALRDEKVGTPLLLMGKSSRIWHEPLGVVLVISPWNYPFHIALTTMAAALMAGNGVVFKPSEVTPLQGVIERLLADLPPLRNAVRVAYGDGEAGQHLIDARPDKIFFTGSTRTGQRIAQQAAQYLIPVDLELGGKDPAIVFEDVDVGRTAAGILWGAMTNAGQSCTSVERLLVHQSLYPALREALQTQAEALVVNSGDRGDADYGAITADFQQHIIEAHVADAKARGAHLLCGGDALDVQARLYPPTLIDGLSTDAPAWTDETFGPTLVMVPFRDEAEAIRLANDSRYGLSASVWSRDLLRATRVARALRAGAVSINNVMLTEGNPELPFGGAGGASGTGRVKGIEGLRGMTRSKAVLIDRQSAKIEANWYPYTRTKYVLFDRLVQAVFGRGWKRWIEFARAGMALEKVASRPRGE